MMRCVCIYVCVLCFLVVTRPDDNQHPTALFLFCFVFVVLMGGFFFGRHALDDI